MTRTDIIHEIEELEAKAEAAIDYGSRAKAHRYLDEIAELEGTLSAMPHEFGGEV